MSTLTSIGSISSEASFNEAYPVAFRILNEKHEEKIYLEDKPSSGLLELTNESGDNLYFIPHNDAHKIAGPDNYHFALKFRPGIIKSDPKSLIKNKLIKKGWVLSIGLVNLETGEVIGDHPSLLTGAHLEVSTTVLYFYHIGQATFQKDEKIILPLKHLHLQCEEGTQVTQVELTCNNISKSEDYATKFESHIRHYSLTIINHRGSPHLPIHVGFTGFNTILNDGQSANSLNLRITNLQKKTRQSKGTFTLSHRRHSRMYLYFDTDSDKREDALGRTDQVGAIELGIRFPNQKDESYLVHEPHFQGDRPVWEIYPEDGDVVLQPHLTVLDEKTDDLPDDSCFDITISNLITDFFMGVTRLYLRFENIPGYWDHTYAIPIVKQPMIFKKEDGEERVGIGTVSPKAKLDVFGNLKISEGAIIEGNVGIEPPVSGALDFDGESYIEINSDVGIPISNEEYTIEAFIKPTEHGINGIVGWGNYGTETEVNALRLGTNKEILNYWWGPENDLIASCFSTLADRKWHHIVASFDGTTRKIFLDGRELKKDEPKNHNVPSAANLRIGVTHFPPNNEYFKGSIAEVRIWNVARTGEQIRECMHIQFEEPQAGLVAYYKFNDGIAGGDNTGKTNLTDSSGNRNHGTLKNFQLTGNASNWVAGPSKALALKVKGDILINGGATTTGGATITGNVGIGMNNPQEKLHVNGRIKDQTGFVMPVGSIIAYGGSTPPEGWLLCNGQALNNDRHSELIAAIGMSNTPDLRSRFIVGSGQGNGLSNYNLKDKGGEEKHFLTKDEMPRHKHDFQAESEWQYDEEEATEKHDFTYKKEQEVYAKNTFMDFFTQIKRIKVKRGGADFSDGDIWGRALQREIKVTIKDTGGDDNGDTVAHENRPPYYALTYIIKY